jgi:hypothetical protein
MTGKLNGQGDTVRRRLTHLILIACAAGAAALGAPAGATAGTLDQSQTSHTASHGFNGLIQEAQTFNAGRTGLLDQVDVFLYKDCNASGITVEIRTVSVDGKPTNTPLASAAIPDASVPTLASPQFVSATFASPASVAAGTKYAIVLSASTSSSCVSGPPYWWSSAPADPYPPGQLFSSADGGMSWTPLGGYDHAFKTYVADPPPPPPPPPSEEPPPPESNTPTTPAQFTRTLSISYSQKKDAFRGKLTSQAAACISGQKVKVFEKEKGKDPKVGSLNTSASGKYSLKEKNAEGKFYAQVGKTSTSAGTCLAARSKAIEVG